MASLYSLALLAATFTSFALGQQNDTVWGAVTVSTFGDRIPLLSPNYSVITPLGAEQMYDAGYVFRDRYINSTSNYTISGISLSQIDNAQTYTFTPYEVWIEQSAQAFMGGLYPPLSTVNITGVITPQGQTLANNETIPWPNNGMQYPFIYSTSENDLNDIYLEGMANCPLLQQSIDDYEASGEFQHMVSSTNSFYQSLSGDFSAALSQDNQAEPWNLSYVNAYEIWEFLSYQNIHNDSSGISTSDVNQARYLADAYTWSIYGSETATIQTLGGRTLLAFILEQLSNNIETSGASKLVNAFISYEPLISLFSLLGLHNLNDDFKGMPNLASSISFELYTNSSTPVPIGSYPDPNDLNIRFLFRNGSTLASSFSTIPIDLDVYPVFNNTQNQEWMTLNDFFATAEKAMVFNIGQWCEICQSEAVFCPAFTNGSVGLPSSPAASSHQLSPVIAGVIGALVALAVAGILFLLAMILFGIRFRRLKTRRRSELGGFKGSEKLASDPDLPSQKPGGAKSGAVVGASVVPAKEGEAGHKRVESWELKEGRGAAAASGRPSLEEDAEGKMKGVEALERV